MTGVLLCSPAIAAETGVALVCFRVNFVSDVKMAPGAYTGGGWNIEPWGTP